LPLLGDPAATAGYAEFQKKLQELEKAVTEYRTKNKKLLDEKNRKNSNELRALQKKVDAFKASSPAAPPRGMVLVDGAKPRDARVLLRGNPGSPGAVAPRQFLTVLSREKPRPFKDGSGRLELARAIADRDNPLTARVFVNRLWRQHFGAGLVATTSDFGLRSEPPSHPELLDYLAWKFMDDGWSVKKMHRLMVLSKTYQLSSAEPEDAARREIDPENRLLAHANRRRLEFEPLRDALLATTGNLDFKIGGPGADITSAPYSTRRTIYSFVDRQNLPDVFRTFDFASPDASTSRRYQTTVPQQALYLLNNPFVIEQARILLRRAAVTGKNEEKIETLHRLLYARHADAEEVRMGLRFLESAAGSQGPQNGQALTPWERYAQVLLAANEFVFID
jgi:hypothetical protein